MQQQSLQIHAAVMVLYDKTADALVLTQRSAQLKNHPGEISFPGGQMQEGDSDSYHTALRELQEELGIAANRIIDPLAMAIEHTLTGFVIHPWFAKIEQLQPYYLDQHEVAAVFTLPFKEVCKAENYQIIEIERQGFRIKTLQYRADERFIWGATARIMQQLQTNIRE